MSTLDKTIETAADLKDDLLDAAKTARGKVADAAASARETGAHAVEELRARAGDTAGAIADAATERADAARTAIGDVGERMADGLRSAASDAPDDSLRARSLNLLAGGISDMAQGLNGQNLGSMFQDARAFARRNPGICALGAAVAGFALLRMIRAEPAADAAADGNSRPVLRNQPDKVG